MVNLSSRQVNRTPKFARLLLEPVLILWGHVSNVPFGGPTAR